MGTSIVVAPDKFKGSLSAAEAVDAMRRGCRSAVPDAEVRDIPVSDGGEGMLAIVRARGGVERTVEVTGPLGEPVVARYVVQEDVAFIETAEACGLAHVPTPSPGTALVATSYGVGELVLDALDQGCARIYLGLGGSACTDGGAGMAQALGARLLDHSGKEVVRGGQALLGLARIDASGLDPRVHDTQVCVAHDVENPLLGPRGAAAVYAPQKGADRNAVGILEAALRRYAHHLDAGAAGPVAERAGAGAAGGLGAGAFALLGATSTSGARLMLDVVDARRTMSGAGLVLVGEGRLDAQTGYGKAPSAVAQLADELGIPCVAVAGVVHASPRDLHRMRICRAFSLVDHARDPRDSADRAAELLEGVTDQAVRWWLSA